MVLCILCHVEKGRWCVVVRKTTPKGVYNLIPKLSYGNMLRYVGIWGI